MFNKFSKPSTVIEFDSNPALSDEPRVVPFEDAETGRIINKVSYFPVSNKSFFDGLIYDENVHSLRAKLNLGVPLHEVPALDLSSFDSAFAIAKKFCEDVSVNFDKLVVQEKSSIEKVSTDEIVSN